jgi:hypothetical protein
VGKYWSGKSSKIFDARAKGKILLATKLRSLTFQQLSDLRGKGKGEAFF